MREAIDAATRTVNVRLEQYLAVRVNPKPQRLKFKRTPTTPTAHG